MACTAWTRRRTPRCCLKRALRAPGGAVPVENRQRGGGRNLPSLKRRDCSPQISSFRSSLSRTKTWRTLARTDGSDTAERSSAMVMKKSLISDYILIFMKNLNFLIIAFLSAIMSYCLFGFIRENSALEFMLKIDAMLMAVWKMPVVAISLSVVFLLLLSIQSTSNTALFFKLVLKIAVIFCISAIIGFSYTGIVLLILADTMRYIPSSKGKM